MQQSLLVCTRRFFVGTYNIVLLFLLAGLTIRASTCDSFFLLIVGLVAGALAYMYSESFAHRRMHTPGTPFYKSHSEHHLVKTPESGLPRPWLYLVYLMIGAALIALDVQILTGFYLGILAYLTVYEYVHFLCHCNYKPKTRLGWRVRINHLKHHNHNEHQHFELLFLKRRS